MTPNELKKRRQQLQMSQAQLGLFLRTSLNDPSRTIRKWESGERGVPNWLDVMLQFMEQTDKDKWPK